MAESTVSLEFMSRQIVALRDHVNARFDAVDARFGMLQGMLTRLDSADMGLPRHGRQVAGRKINLAKDFR